MRSESWSEWRLSLPWASFERHVAPPIGGQVASSIVERHVALRAREALLMPRWLRLAIVVAVSALVVVLILAFRRAPQDLRTGTVGKPAAAFTLQKLDGTGTMVVDAPSGRVTVINFWASWCIPCKEENPALVRVYERYRSSEVVFIGVLYQDSRENGLKYVKDNGVTWLTGSDDDGRVAFAYGVFGIPETFFIGTDGVVAGRHIGPIDETTLVNGIESLRAKAKK